MDIEKLDINAVCFGILCNFPPVCGEERAKEAVELVRTLQAENERLKNKLSELAHLPFDSPGVGERTRLMAENEKLRAELKSKVDLVFRQAKELDRRHLLLQEQEAELEQVKRALDEAREAICTHCMDFPCGEDSCYWWRGPEEV